ncbi:hypothetical protein F511_24864 [Dorcoceras hygrometricum]|uniref:Uncharacterized protein n=1 Tax=Dorcoceras hygrometricum TaxID=472368 RepID=A0A2Z7AKZ0_9LAMI|nr:hypothetical protein F511_24864 [Dorcoceras hygrometricum]
MSALLRYFFKVGCIETCHRPLFRCDLVERWRLTFHRACPNRTRILDDVATFAVVMGDQVNHLGQPVLQQEEALSRPLLSQTPPPPPPCAAAAAARLRRKFVSGQFDEENPFVLISSVLLVQADEGVSFLVMDRIGDIYRSLPRRADVIVTKVGARHKCQQDRKFETFESNASRRRVRRRPIACAREARDLRAGRARETHAGRSKGATGRDDGRCLLAGSHTRRRTVAHWLGDDARMAARLRRAIAQHWPAAAAPCLDSLRDDGWRRAAMKRRCWSGDVRWLRAICARRCIALGAASRALPPRFRGGGAAAGRRSGESPAMS